MAELLEALIGLVCLLFEAAFRLLPVLLELAAYVIIGAVQLTRWIWRRCRGNEFLRLPRQD